MSGRKVQESALKGQKLYEQQHRLAFACEQIAGLKVLHLGCGQGEGSAVLAGSAVEVVAVDADSDAIARARSDYANLGSLTFEVGDLERLPVGDALFDVVLSLDAAALTASPKKLIREMGRVLKPGGFVIVTLRKSRKSSGVAASDETGDVDFGTWERRLSDQFANLARYGQRMVAASAISPVEAAPAAPNVAEYRAYRATKQGGRPTKTGAGVVRFAEPTSVIFVASNSPIPHVSGPDSMFLTEAMDLWSARSDPSAEDLAAALQKARNRIEALTEARDALERALGGQSQASHTAGSADLSAIGPMMEELAGRPIPVDLPNLVKLLGQFASLRAQHDARLAEMDRLERHGQALMAETAATSSRLASAQGEIATLTSTKQALMSDLDGINREAEVQVGVLQAAVEKASSTSTVLAERVREQSEVLRDILQDLEEMTDREAAALQDNITLTGERDELAGARTELTAQLERSRQREADFATESHLLANQIVELDQALHEAEKARQRIEVRLQDVERAKDAAVEEHAAEIEAARRAFSAERETLSHRITDLEQSLALSQASRRTVEQSLTEVSGLKRIAENQAAAALDELKQAVNREYATQAEIIRLTEVNSDLTARSQRSELDLAAAQDIIGQQADWILTLSNKSERQAQQLSELEGIATASAEELRRLAAEIESLTNQGLELASREAGLRAEYEFLVAERASWIADRDAWESERQLLKSEREGWIAEARGRESECQSLRLQLEVAAGQQEALEIERHARNEEQQTWNAERAAHHAERASWSEERQALSQALTDLARQTEELKAQLQSAWWTRLAGLRRH